MDILVANVDGPNVVYRRQLDGSLRADRFGAVDGHSYGLVVADWNGDGFLEVAVANSDGKNFLYQLRRQ